MLERIREGAQGPWAMAIIALIVLSFVFAGVGSYLSAPASTAVATVNDEEISANDLERAYQNQRAQMEAQFGEGIASLFSDSTYLAQFRADVLDRLIGDVLLKQHAKELGLRVGDQQIQDAIVNMQEFQVGGQFSNERFLAIIRQAGFQPSEFSDYMRREMIREQLIRAVSGSAFALDEQAKQVALLEQQTRSAKTLTIDAKRFEAEQTVSDEELQVYYDGNLNQFDTQERVDIAYVLLDVASLEKEVEIAEEEAIAFYQAQLASYRKAEERQVSHILVEFDEDRDAAKAKIDAIKARVDGGEAFANVAKSDSADTFSAENGGDLGFISDDMMGEAFSSAAFALVAEGDVSDVIETDFGYHLITVTKINPEQVTPYDEVKDQIFAELKREGAMSKYFEIQSLMAQVAFEVPESLDEVASAANTEIKRTGLVTKLGVPAPLNSPAVTSQAFSPDFIEEQLNSDIVEISDDTIVVFRINEHEPARTKSLEEVRAQITTTLLAEKAQKAATDWADSLVAAIIAGEDISAKLAEQSLSWESKEAVTRRATDMPQEITKSLFTLATEAGKDIDVVALNSGDVAVVQVVSVNEPESIEDEIVTQFKQRLTSMNSQTTIVNYIEALRKEAEVVVNL